MVLCNVYIVIHSSSGHKTLYSALLRYSIIAKQIFYFPDWGFQRDSMRQFSNHPTSWVVDLRIMRFWKNKCFIVIAFTSGIPLLPGCEAWNTPDRFTPRLHQRIWFRICWNYDEVCTQNCHETRDQLRLVSHLHFGQILSNRPKTFTKPTNKKLNNYTWVPRILKCVFSAKNVLITITGQLICVAVHKEWSCVKLLWNFFVYWLNPQALIV